MFSVRREESLRAQSVQQVREAIVTGALAPGNMYSEQMIAAQMGISRTPVREALLHLATEGLVEFVPHRGVRITQLDPGHLVDVLEFRAMLESYSAAMLAQHPRPEVIAALDEQLDRQRQIESVNDRLQWVAANVDFHRTIVDSVGNRMTSETFAALAAHTMRMGYKMISRQERMQESIDEHAAILGAIRNGDADEARRLAIEHLRVTKTLMKRLFDGLDAGSAQEMRMGRERA